MGCLLIPIWLIGFAACLGWFYPDLQGERCSDDDDVDRESLGFAVLISMFMACLGPLGLIVALCMTGFARHGWYLPYRLLWRKR